MQPQPGENAVADGPCKTFGILRGLAGQINPKAQLILTWREEKSFGLLAGKIS
jgi:hypothetical protein